MQVQVLVVPDCPHTEPAAAIVRQALDELGLGHVPVTTALVTTQAQAEQLDFVGSPTIMIDGRDPFAHPGQSPGLACRLYRDKDTLTGTPPADQIRRVLGEAADA